MITRACLSLALITALPSISQTLATEADDLDLPDDEYRMPIPPVASSVAFPTAGLAATRSNYFDLGLAFQTSFYDNLLAGSATNPIKDEGFSIAPQLKFDQLTPRLHESWTYRSSFLLYRKTSARNDADQGAAFDVQYRWSPHITVSGRDIFEKSSNVFNRTYPLGAEPLSGAPPTSPANVIAPFAPQLTNSAGAELAWQFSKNQIVGAGGNASTLQYRDRSQSTGLYDSTSKGASGFYSRRLFGTQYAGFTYRYLKVLGQPVSGTLEIDTHTLFFSYSMYVGHRLTVSSAVGPQFYNYIQAPLPASRSLTQAVTASVSWQGLRTAFATNFSRSVVGGAGQFGALSSNAIGASAQWQVAAKWSLAAAANYALYKSATPFVQFASQGGHSTSGSISLDHRMSDHFLAQVGYQRLHQTYENIQAIQANPDANSAFIAISYQLSRPLGR